MTAPLDMTYLATSAGIVATDMAAVVTTLSEGGRCLLPSSRRGARRSALQRAVVARDRLEALIAELEG